MNYKLRFFRALALLSFLFCNFTFLIQNCLWVVCDVFLVPPKSYAEVLNPMAGKKILSSQPHLSPSNKMKLCPFQEAGECKYGSQCVYIHGDTCDLCGHACLHPQDNEQRKKHINVSSDHYITFFDCCVMVYYVLWQRFFRYTGAPFLLIYKVFYDCHCFRVLHSEVFTVRNVL